MSDTQSYKNVSLSGEEQALVLMALAYYMQQMKTEAESFANNGMHVAANVHLKDVQAMRDLMGKIAR